MSRSARMGDESCSSATGAAGPVRYRAFSSTLHPVPALFALCSAAQSSSFLASDFTSSRLLDKANGKAATAV